MKHILATLAVGFGLVAAPAASYAVTVPIDTAVLAGGAGFIGGGDTIKFDANVTGESATFTLASVPGTPYVISVTGHNDASSSFFRFLIDRDGPGAGGFVQLGSDLNFGSGFSTITLPSFIDLGTFDFFRIVNGGTGNTAGQITGVTINAVPGPIVGAGLPGLVIACGGLVALARRRRKRTFAA
jgi:hypothetical protein